MRLMSKNLKLRLDQEGHWSALMAKAQDGDSHSYNLLLSELAPHIRSFCRQKVGYLDLSDDVVQEALIAIHRFRHTYDPKRPFIPWLNTIVRNKVIDNLRSRHRVMNREILSQESVDSAVAVAAVQTQDLNKYLGELPPEYREPLRLLKLEEYSVDEVASQLRITSSAVKMRVHRALKILKKKAERDVYE
jgi:RNA polymerase sigma-70 factor, ECF subfamily